MRNRRHTAGAVYVESIAAIPVVVMFFMTLWQLAELATCQLIVEHAAARAVRAAVVIGPDNPRFYEDQAIDDIEVITPETWKLMENFSKEKGKPLREPPKGKGKDGPRQKEIMLAAQLIVRASPLLRKGNITVDVEFIKDEGPEDPAKKAEWEKKKAEAKAEMEKELARIAKDGMPPPKVMVDPDKVDGLVSVSVNAEFPCSFSLMYFWCEEGKKTLPIAGSSAFIYQGAGYLYPGQAEDASSEAHPPLLDQLLMGGTSPKGGGYMPQGKN